jgi:hypothetical protein
MTQQVSINKKLNLVIPLDTGTVKIWIHSMPISREVFESNYMLLTKTLANLYANGVGSTFATRIAALSLKDVAKEMSDEGQDISVNFIQEINRLTNVLMPGNNGWQTIPFVEVKNKKLIDEQLLSEVENAIVYFTVASAIHLRSELSMVYQSLKSVWNAQTSLLNVTEFANSLQTSKTSENTGEKIQETHKVAVPKQSSIPS